MAYSTNYVEEVFFTSKTHVHCLVWGSKGEKVLLLHGFPETPHIFQEIATILVGKGYQVFAPFMPGYGPTKDISPETGGTHLNELAACIGELSIAIRQDDEERMVLVGHDWGAAITYASAAAFPELYSKIVTMAVPPLPVFLKGLIKFPMQFWRSRYMLLFQLRGRIAESISTKDDFQYLKDLVEKWSGGSEPSKTYFSKHSDSFRSMGELSGPLGYYRGLFPLLSGSLSKWLASTRLAYSKINIPAEILSGADDGCISSEIFVDLQDHFDAPVSLTVVPDAGHFLPIDAPDIIVEKIISSL